MQEFNKGVYDYIIASDESTGNREQDDVQVEEVADAEVDTEECE